MSNEDISGISLITTNSSIKDANFLNYDAIKDAKWYKQIEAMDGKSIWLPTIPKPRNSYSEDNTLVFTFGRMIHNITTGKPIGTILIDMKVNYEINGTYESDFIWRFNSGWSKNKKP